MVDGTLAAGSLFGIGSGLLYGYVGWRLGRRQVDHDKRLAAIAFATWWHSLAGFSLLTNAVGLLAALGRLDPDLFVSTYLVGLMGLCVAVAALLYYLLFLFTGRVGLWKPLAVGYLLVLIGLVYLVTSHGLFGFSATTWGLAAAFERPLEGDPTVLLLLVGLLGPQVLGALAYLTLAWKTRQRTLRYRIILVSCSLLVWLGTSLVASASGATQSEAWQAASRIMGLGAPVLILMAYFPPPPLRRRLGLVSVDEPLPAAGA